MGFSPFSTSEAQRQVVSVVTGSGLSHLDWHSGLTCSIPGGSLSSSSAREVCFCLKLLHVKSISQLWHQKEHCEHCERAVFSSFKTRLSKSAWRGQLSQGSESAVLVRVGTSVVLG